MARVLKGSHSFTCKHTPRSTANGMNHTYTFAFPAEAGPHLPTPDGWKAELAWKTTGATSYGLQVAVLDIATFVSFYVLAECRCEAKKWFDQKCCYGAQNVVMELLSPWGIDLLRLQQFTITATTTDLAVYVDFSSSI